METNFNFKSQICTTREQSESLLTLGLKKETAAKMVCAVLFGAFLVMLIEKGTPTALDVYRGKTTLEITYRDSVAVDSVVVYKMK